VRALAAGIGDRRISPETLPLLGVSDHVDRLVRLACLTNSARRLNDDYLPLTDLVVQLRPGRRPRQTATPNGLFAASATNAPTDC
jgi:hypothetical protein